MAGPYACMLLGDLGADVIKIEPPGTGDQTRGSMGFKMKGPDSLGFLNMNRNKRSVTLDLKTEAGKQVLLRMARDADILVENYRPGALRRMGLGYEDLKAVNPRLVYTSISGFRPEWPLGRPPRL
jgi:crotonobetainyl-CoA:carnitine CoA-transferase CaiB-like acyl-CoA transferase